MIKKFSHSSGARSSGLRKVALGTGAAIVALGMGASASASGAVSAGYSSGYYGGGGYYAAGYKSHGSRGHYRGHGRRHHGHGHRHGGGGGKAAAIALGVIGGAIILNEIAEDRERDRRARERYYEDRYARRADVYDDDGYYGGDDEYYSDDYDTDDYGNEAEAGAYDGVYEDELEGGDPAVRPEPIRVSSSAAYETCLRHARTALGERGFVVSAPYRPDTVENRGGAVLMTATVTAQRGAERWARAMSCEASETRVYRMELI